MPHTHLARTRSAHEPPAGAAPYSSTLEEEGGYSEALLPWAPVDVEEDAPTQEPLPTRPISAATSLPYQPAAPHQPLQLPRTVTAPAQPARGLLDAKTYQQAVWADLTYDSPALVRRQLAMVTSTERPARTQSAYQPPRPPAMLALGDVGPHPSTGAPVSEEASSQLRTEPGGGSDMHQHLLTSPRRDEGHEASTSGRPSMILGGGYTNPHKFLSKAWRETFWNQVI
jgi:hypothetical protein